MNSTLLLVIVIVAIVIVVIVIYNNNNDSSTPVPPPVPPPVSKVSIQNASTNGFLAKNANGTSVLLGADAENWTFVDGKLLNVPSGKCLSRVQPISAELFLTVCDNATQFILINNTDGTKQIKPAFGTVCLNSSPNVMVSCDSTFDNQKWNISNV